MGDAGAAAAPAPAVATRDRIRRILALAAPTTLVADAHRAGLLVHPYTFRDDPVFLAPDYVNDPQAEYLQFFRLGVDAVFSDFPDSAFRARARFLHDTRATP